MEWITISTKVKKEAPEKAWKYGINVSEALRENKIARKEEEEARNSARKISKELKLPEEEVARIIRER